MRLQGKTLVALAAILPLISAGQAEATVIASINPGDTIRITSTLSTTDPNENGEGEPIVLMAGGQTISVDPTYAVPATFTYTAPPVIIAPGSPVPQTAISYYIQGADGDETASVNSVINPNPTPKTQSQIAGWNNDTYYLGLFSGAVGVAGASGCPYAGPYVAVCGIATGVIGGLSGMLSAYYAKLAADPVDPNYTVIATPATATLPSGLTVGQGLATTEIKAIATAAALLTSINRYQGAVAAGDTTWEAKQLAAIEKYIGLLNGYTGQLGSQVAAFVDQLKKIGLTATISTSQALAAETTLAQNGLPQSVLDIFQQLGLSPADIQSAFENTYVQNINLLAGQYPNMLNSFVSPISSVPEPGTLPLLAAGLAMLGGVRYRGRRRRRAALA